MEKEELLKIIDAGHKAEEQLKSIEYAEKIKINLFLRNKFFKLNHTKVDPYEYERFYCYEYVFISFVDEKSVMGTSFIIDFDWNVKVRNNYSDEAVGFKRRATEITKKEYDEAKQKMLLQIDSILDQGKNDE